MVGTSQGNRGAPDFNTSEVLLAAKQIYVAEDFAALKSWSGDRPITPGEVNERTIAKLLNQGFSDEQLKEFDPEASRYLELKTRMALDPDGFQAQGLALVKEDGTKALVAALCGVNLDAELMTKAAEQLRGRIALTESGEEENADPQFMNPRKRLTPNEDPGSVRLLEVALLLAEIEFQARRADE